MKAAPLRDVLLGAGFAALLAACSTTAQGLTSLPNASSHSNGTVGDGKAAKVALWASNTPESYLFGVNGALTKTVDIIDTKSNGCYEPAAIKVDHEQNIWVACEEVNPTSRQFGGELEYGSNGAFKRSYGFSPAQCDSRSDCYAVSYDGGPDKFGHVFAELSAGNFYYLPHWNLNPGFYWWNAGDPSAPATFIQASLYCAPFCQISYMDTDNSGNIWFSFAGPSIGKREYPAGLGEVTNPTTSPSVKVVLRPGTFKGASGVYVSGDGTVLNVTDSVTRKTYQYRLPVKRNSKPFNILGPTARRHGMGVPVSGGFNEDESELALGDSFGWIDIGQIRTNTWSIYPKPDFACLGAAFTPSDK